MSDLKRLRTRLREAQNELTDANTSLDDARARAKKALGEVQSLEKQIKHETKEVVVTEHAVLRYLERVKLVDTKAVRKAILPEDARKKAKALGTAKIPVGNTHVIVVKDNAVVTVHRADEFVEPEVNLGKRPVPLGIENKYLMGKLEWNEIRNLVMEHSLYDRRLGFAYSAKADPDEQAFLDGLYAALRFFHQNVFNTSIE